MPFSVRKSPWLTGSSPSNRRRLPEHTRPSNGQWKACVNRMARGRMFVDVVFDVVSLWSSFSVCFGTYLGALEKGVSMRVLVIVALALCAFSSQVQAASPKGETQEGKAEAEFKSEQGDLSQQLGINDIPTAGC